MLACNSAAPLAVVVVATGARSPPEDQRPRDLLNRLGDLNAAGAGIGAV